MILEHILSVSTQNTPPSTSNSLYSLIFLVVFVVYISYRRLYRGMHGGKFSKVRLLRIPIIYSVITVISAVFMPLEYIFIALGIGLAGLAVGSLYGDTARFFDRNSNTYYTRSPIIMVIWLAAFISRIGIELFYTTSTSFFGSTGSTLPAIIVNMLLAGSTGLLAGETIRIYRKYEEYKNSGSDSMTIDGSDAFLQK